MNKIIAEEVLKRVQKMKLKSIDDVLNLSNEDFNAWIYLKSRYHHGSSTLVASVILKRFLREQKD